MVDSYISIDVGQAHATGICSPAIVAPVVTAPPSSLAAIAVARRKAHGLRAGRNLFFNLGFVNYCHDLA